MGNYREEWFKHNKSDHGWYTCAECKKKFRKADMDVDHIIPQKYGGSDSLFNLQGLCKHCNRSKQADVSDTVPDLMTNNANRAVKETKTVVTTTAKAVAKTVTKVVKKVAKTVAKKTAKPVAKKTAKPVAKKTAKPVAKKTAKPVAKKTAKPVAKKTAKPVAKKTAKPVAKKGKKS